MDINIHDYGFRYYDPAIARFTTIDPLAEEYHFQSDFAYAANNPILFIDAFGLGPEQMGSIEGIETKFVNEKGETIAVTDDGSYETFVIKEDQEAAFVEELTTAVESSEDLKEEVNIKLGKKHGYNIKDSKKQIMDGNGSLALAAREGYNEGYDDSGGGGFWIQFQKGTGSAYGAGKGRGAGDAAAGKMKKTDPKSTNTKASNYVKTNEAPRRQSIYRYSSLPIPLLLNDNH